MVEEPKLRGWVASKSVVRRRISIIEIKIGIGDAQPIGGGIDQIVAEFRNRQGFPGDLQNVVLPIMVLAGEGDGIPFRGVDVLLGIDQWKMGERR